ncbi:unnamed protein product [Caenorhabditis bovis]|uniref:Uncharacterized protein n=1 Tax=Caenorhabditis bovis TaxID=2654633 RepID=A0A8S1FCJ6_9PELO|nr:unnamed protein product [Caenorhabditis bovis]
MSKIVLICCIAVAIAHYVPAPVNPYYYNTNGQIVVTGSQQELLRIGNRIISQPAKASINCQTCRLCCKATVPWKTEQYPIYGYRQIVGTSTNGVGVGVGTFGTGTSTTGISTTGTIGGTQVIYTRNGTSVGTQTNGGYRTSSNGGGIAGGNTIDYNGGQVVIPGSNGGNTNGGQVVIPGSNGNNGGIIYPGNNFPGNFGPQINIPSSGYAVAPAATTQTPCNPVTIPSAPSTHPPCVATTPNPGYATPASTQGYVTSTAGYVTTPTTIATYATTPGYATAPTPTQGYALPPSGYPQHGYAGYSAPLNYTSPEVYPIPQGYPTTTTIPGYASPTITQGYAQKSHGSYADSFVSAAPSIPSYPKMSVVAMPTTDSPIIVTTTTNTNTNGGIFTPENCCFVNIHNLKATVSCGVVGKECCKDARTCPNTDTHTLDVDRAIFGVPSGPIECKDAVRRGFVSEEQIRGFCTQYVPSGNSLTVSSTSAIASILAFVVSMIMCL